MRSILDYDEVNALASVSEPQDRASDLMSIMILAYMRGARETADDLFWDYVEDMILLNEALYQEKEGKTAFDRASTTDDFARLAENEAHRMYNTGAYDCAKQCQASGASIYKTWNTMEDNRVRDTHEYIEHDSVPIGDEFYTFDGDHARYPGDFQSPENNIGCRCFITYTRR